MAWRRFFPTKRIVFFCFLCCFWVLIANVTLGGVQQGGTNEAKADKPFDTQEMVMDHITDHHNWHLWGKTYIHLPVILLTDKGLETFSSSKFLARGHTYQGNYTYKLSGEKIAIVFNNAAGANGSVGANGAAETAGAKKPFLVDLSITKNVATLLLSVVILCLLFIPVGSKYRREGNKAPSGLQNTLEPLILLVRDEIAVPNLGRNYKRFMPFLLTIFFFIWLNNLIGLLPFFPGGANLTGNIALTFTLAIITFIITNVNGKKGYWQHVFAPDVPKPLWLIMIPIEVISLFVRPASLMIRLFANITAGHILVLSLIALIFIFKSAWVAAAAVPFVLFISFIELLVGFIQAFIFATLASLYIGTALSDHHDH